MNGERTIRILKRLIPFLLGLAILAVLYWRIGWSKLVHEMQSADARLFVVALAFFVPQVVVMTWRWQLIGGTARRLGFWEACGMVLAGSSLNVVLPSKLGDMCKGLMLGEKAEHGLAGGLGLAALDKLMDIVGLAVVLALAGILAPKPEAWVLAFWLATCAGVVFVVVLLHAARPIERLPHHKALAALARALNAAIAVRRRRAAWAASLGLSVLLWFLHIGQIYVFYRAVAGADPAPAAAIFLRVPTAIFIGLLPITLAGIGTRDGALIVLIEPQPVAALVGLFCTLRYVVMALLGVPAIISLGPTLTSALRSARRRKATKGQAGTEPAGPSHSPQ
jgi:hypothetical protein